MELRGREPTLDAVTDKFGGVSTCRKGDARRKGSGSLDESMGHMSQGSHSGVKVYINHDSTNNANTFHLDLFVTERRSLFP